MVLRLYNSAGFHIKTLHTSLQGQVLRNGGESKGGPWCVKMNFTNALDHVPEAEQNNRTIKERVCMAYHQLLNKALPRQL
jgi:hypothetical protein